MTTFPFSPEAGDGEETELPGGPGLVLQRLGLLAGQECVPLEVVEAGGVGVDAVGAPVPEVGGSELALGHDGPEVEVQRQAGGDQAPPQAVPGDVPLVEVVDVPGGGGAAPVDRQAGGQQGDGAWRGVTRGAGRRQGHPATTWLKN